MSCDVGGVTESLENELCSFRYVRLRGQSISGATSLNVRIFDGAFRKIFLILEINLSTPGKKLRISSDTL